jgi:hypothetical protein
MAIKQLKERIDKVAAMIAQHENLMIQEPKPAQELELFSLKAHLQDLHTQLKRANTDRYKEVIEMRLIGEAARYGSLPLDIAGDLTSAFSRALINTSKNLQFGKKEGKEVNRIVKSTIDLRLEAIGTGSTIFYLSGKTSPDMFGHSLIQDCLESMFNLFDSESSDTLADNLTRVGAKSIKYYSQFFKELSEENLELEMKWSTPEDRVLFWRGDKDKINSFYNTINKIQISEPEEFSFEGKLIGHSIKGKFEIETVDKKTFIGTFPNELLGTMKSLHIGDICAGSLSKTAIVNPLTGNERTEYSLVKITSI